MAKPWRADTWTYSVEEISAGVYAATADDGQGSLIREVGTDDEALLTRVKKAAANLTERRRAVAADTSPPKRASDEA